MSSQDVRKWRAKFIGGTHPRVEIRTQIGQTLLLVVVAGKGFKQQSKWDDVSPKAALRISMNGVTYLDATKWRELLAAVTEARTLLEKGSQLNRRA